MTKQEWLEQVKSKRAEFAAILLDWHPSRPKQIGRGVVITAEAAERACERIRQDIQKQGKKNPVDLFLFSLETGEAEVVSKLLNEAWFGFPEDRRLALDTPGFMVMCDLLSDMWDDAPDTDA